MPPPSPSPSFRQRAPRGIADTFSDTLAQFPIGIRIFMVHLRLPESGIPLRFSVSVVSFLRVALAAFALAFPRQLRERTTEIRIAERRHARPYATSPRAASLVKYLPPLARSLRQPFHPYSIGRPTYLSGGETSTVTRR